MGAQRTAKHDWHPIKTSYDTNDVIQMVCVQGPTEEYQNASESQFYPGSPIPHTLNTPLGKAS